MDVLSFVTWVLIAVRLGLVTSIHNYPQLHLPSLSQIAGVLEGKLNYCFVLIWGLVCLFV